MKVLFLIDTLEGYGAEKSIVEIAQHMEEITPVFVHLYSGDKLKPSLVESGITVYSLNMKSNLGYNEPLQELTRIVEKEKPTILHSTLFRADMVARKLKKSFPNLILVGSFVSNSYSMRRYSELSILSRLKLFTTQIRDFITVGKVNFFICNSYSIQRTNIKALRISPEVTQVIYRGRTFDDFEPDDQKILSVRKELEIGDRKVLLNVGRLYRSKGQMDLLQAFSLFLKNHPLSLLLIAGEGPLRRDLEKKIEHLKLSNQVKLLGYREDIPQLLQVSDFFVFPSYFEGLPGALIEAIISKKPCIVSDIPENRECFGGEGALFFPAGDVHELHFKMEEALQIDDWEQKIGASYQHAQKNFDVRSISRKYELFYKSLKETA